MKFNSTDAWLLHAIHHSNEGGYTSLRNVIAFADYSNHAIMTFAEFSSSLPKLITASLVVSDGDRLKTSSTFQQWRDKKFKGKKSVSVMKEMIEIEKFLTGTFQTLDEKVSSIDITPQQFQKDVDEYCQRASG